MSFHAIGSKRYTDVSDYDQRFLQRLESFIEENLTNDQVSVDQLAAELSMSQQQLNRKVWALLGQSYVDYVLAARLRKAARMLSDDQPITEVVNAVGFSSHSYFSECFKARYGQTPSEYQKLNPVKKA